MYRNTTTLKFSLSDRYQPHSAQQGGMGVVIFCEDKQDHRPVALKTWKPELLSKRSSRVRFLEEAADWIYLGKHPNIVTAYRVESMGNPPRPYIVMEHIRAASEGFPVSLSQHLSRADLRPFPLQRALHIALDITRGMRHAVSKIQGLVHRDLKPGNILIDQRGHAHICDFGMLQTLTKEAAAQRRSLLEQMDDKDYIPAGTPAYIAPEAWSRLNTVDCRADIYALGLIMLEMLTGKQAVPPQNRSIARETHCSGTLTSLDASQPRGVHDLIQRCTALCADDRFPDWAALESAIERLIEQTSGSPPAPLHLQENPANLLDNARSYLSIGESFLDLGYADVAGPYIEQVLKLAGQLSDISLQIQSTISLARVRVSEGELDAAVATLLDAPSQTNGLAEQHEYIDIQALLGNLYARQGKYKQAIEVLKQALSDARLKSDEGAQILLLGSIANAYAEQHSFARAILYYRSQLEQLRARNDSLNTATCLVNLGACFVDAGQPDAGLPKLTEGAALSERIGDLVGHGRALKLLCEAHQCLNDIPSLCHHAHAYLRHCRQFDHHQESARMEALIKEYDCDKTRSRKNDKA